MEVMELVFFLNMCQWLKKAKFRHLISRLVDYICGKVQLYVLHALNIHNA